MEQAHGADDRPRARTRRYHSPQRREQALQTEHRIVAAAARMLTEQGWAATTLAQVARAAGVSSAMLYKVFRTKADLAKRVYDVAVVGDQDRVPFRERPDFLAVLAVSDLTAKGRGYAHLIRGLVERVLPSYEQLRAAMVIGDAELGQFGETVDAERLYGATGIVRDLLTVADLAPGLDHDVAVDLVWTLMSPDYWALLVTRRGWNWDDTESHVARQITGLFIEKGALPMDV